MKDGDEYSTDLMKCLKEVERKEFEDGRSVGSAPYTTENTEIDSTTSC